MVKKYFILNANNFGISQEYNQAILEGYNNGFLTSATICANGETFDNAVHDILPDCPDLGIGIQLNDGIYNYKFGIWVYTKGV